MGGDTQVWGEGGVDQDDCLGPSCSHIYIRQFWFLDSPADSVLNLLCFRVWGRRLRWTEATARLGRGIRSNGGLSGRGGALGCNGITQSGLTRFGLMLISSLPPPPAFLSWFRNGLLASGIGVISFMQSDMGREAAYGECRHSPSPPSPRPSLVGVDSSSPTSATLVLPLYPSIPTLWALDQPREGCGSLPPPICRCNKDEGPV